LLASFLILWLLAPPVQAITLLRQGLTALRQGHLEEARSALEEAAHVEPQNPYVWASLAETYLRLKEPAKASEAAAKAERGSEGNPPVAHALAMYYRETGDLAHAARLEERYRAAEWEKAKTDPKVTFDYVQVLLRRENFTRAAEVSSTALEANPKDAQLVLALGVARYGQRRFEDAVNLFLSVIQIDSSIEQPYVFLGKMLEQAGSRLPEIIKVYEEWATANPDHAVAQLLWAKALLAADAHDPRAEQLLRRSIVLDGNNWQSHYELGVLLAGKRDYQGAATELNRSITLDPKQALPHYHLARVYDRLGEPERAKAQRQVHQQLTAPKAQ
jgi:tetratricopeptide (TPR) repeat protein